MMFLRREDKQSHEPEKIIYLFWILWNDRTYPIWQHKYFWTKFEGVTVSLKTTISQTIVLAECFRML